MKGRNRRNLWQVRSSIWKGANKHVLIGVELYYCIQVYVRVVAKMYFCFSCQLDEMFFC